jgi:hypothetical protein
MKQTPPLNECNARQFKASLFSEPLYCIVASEKNSMILASSVCVCNMSIYQTTPPTTRDGSTIPSDPDRERSNTVSAK